MKKMPIFSGAYPVFLTARFLAISAAISMGGLIGRSRGISVGNFTRISRMTAGQEVLIKGAFADIGAGSLRYQFCGGADFEHVVESDGEKCVEHDVYILQIIKLCIQGRSRKRDRIPVIADVPEGIIGHGLRVVRAVS